MKYLWIFLLVSCGQSNNILPPAHAQTFASCAASGTWWDGWATTTQSWCGINNNAVSYNINTTQPLAVVGSVHSAQIPGGPYSVAIGGTFFGINDGNVNTWGLYSECDNMIAGTSGCIGLEIDVANNDQGGGPTRGLWIGCGSGWVNPPKYNCSGPAIGITANPRSFPKGIEFTPGSVQGPPSPVIVLNPGQCIVDSNYKPLLCG